MSTSLVLQGISLSLMLAPERRAHSSVNPRPQYSSPCALCHFFVSLKAVQPKVLIHYQCIFLKKLRLSPSLPLRATKSISYSSVTWETGHTQEARVLDSCRLRTIANWTPFHISEEEEEDQDEDRVDGMVRGPGPKGPSGTLSEAQLARRITRGKSSRRMLSNKPQDFQVGGVCCSVCLLSPHGHCCDVVIDLVLCAGAHLLEGI